MEELTKDILRIFRFTQEGISMEKALEFKEVKNQSIIQSKKSSHTENILSQIDVELESGDTEQWYCLSQGWGGGDDADEWIYLYDKLTNAKKEFQIFNN